MTVKFNVEWDADRVPARTLRDEYACWTRRLTARKWMRRGDTYRRYLAF
jgi:hypothetical protein